MVEKNGENELCFYVPTAQSKSIHARKRYATDIDGFRPPCVALADKTKLILSTMFFFKGTFLMYTEGTNPWL